MACSSLRNCQLERYQNFFRVMELTLAQEFKLEILKKDIQKLTKEEAQKYLLEMFRQIMVKENIFKELIRKL